MLGAMAWPALPTHFLATVVTALWAWFELLHIFSAQIIWLKFSNLFDIFRYFFWCSFFGALIIQGGEKRKTPFVYALISIFVIFMVICASSILATFFKNNLWKNYESFLKLSNMLFPIICLVLIEQVFFNATEDVRWRIKPLCLGLSCAFAFDLYLFSQAALFENIDKDALGVRGLSHFLIFPMLWISLTRKSSNNLKIKISPTAIFHSATLLIAGLYLIFISSVAYYVRFFGGEWGRSLQLAIVFLSALVFLVLFLSTDLRAKLRVFVSKNFFNYRFDYRDEWLKLTKTLAANHLPHEMTQQVILGLAGMLESQAGSLWARKTDDDAFGQLASWNHVHTSNKEDFSSSFSQFLNRTGWVLNLLEYRLNPSRYGDIKLPSWLHHYPNAWLVVPLKVADDLIGFCVLDKARNDIEVNWEVNDLLKMAGKQAGGYLAQMQATEAWLEGRKFDSFNRMSAFVVHDLKNIVMQLSLMMKNSKRLLENPEFQRDMLMTVENSVERMRQLMLQLREGSSHSGTPFGVNLKGVVNRLASGSKKNGRHLELQITTPVIAFGNEERIERTLGHVVQNAFDATTLEGRVWLKLDLVPGHARIVIGDTGQGMTPEFIRDRLFKPFQSTKKFGMGIGAYEIFQYVQELGGHVDVQSQVGQGTIVQILLPQFESSKFANHYGLESV